jgi:large subunit ribosomal protein L9
MQGLSTDLLQQEMELMQLKKQALVLTKKQVILEAPIKDLGIHSLSVRLHPEVEVKIELNVARSIEEAELQAAGKSIQDVAAEEEAVAEFEIQELFDDIGTAGLEDFDNDDHDDKPIISDDKDTENTTD